MYKITRNIQEWVGKYQEQSQNFEINSFAKKTFF